MGYTHYFPTKDEGALQALLPKLSQDVAVLVEAAEERGIAIAGPQGTDRPELSDERIAFNGAEPEDYESFILVPNYDRFNFCKTERRPYDVLVVAVLLRAHALSPGALGINSDGDVDDWRAGVELYREVFDAEAVIPPGVIGEPS